MRIPALLIAILAVCSVSFAQENNPLQTEVEEQYYQTQNENPDKSIIYVFFNNQPCENCAKAVDMIEEVYNNNFLNNYSLFLINYGEDSNSGFVQTYNLTNPLEVVMVDVENGEQNGYQKIEGLEYMTPNPNSFNSYFISEVNGYLGENQQYAAKQ